MNYTILTCVSIVLILGFVVIYSPIEPIKTLKKDDEYTINGKSHIFPLEGENYPILKSEVTSKMVNLLEKLTNVLDKSDIPYWLTCGTLLGAVRHGGLIPWDDDIDINVPLEYVDKAKNAIKKDNLGVLDAGGGYKVYHKSTYPFVDLIIVDKVKEKWTMCYPLNKDGSCSYKTAEQWPQECFMDDEVFPLKKIQFENLSLSVPNKYQELIINMYGEKALEEAYYKPFPTLVNHKFNHLLYMTGLISG